MSEKDELLQRLELRWVRVPYTIRLCGRDIINERWVKITNGTVVGQRGTVKLENFTDDQLKALLAESMSQSDYERWYQDQQVELQRVIGE